MSLTLRYVDMWSGFDPQSNALGSLVKSALGEPITVVSNPRKQVDIEIVSVFPPRLRRALHLVRTGSSRLAGRSSDYRAWLTRYTSKSPARARIWYSGENVRPPLSDWALTLGFDPSGWTPQQEYLPLWVLFTDLVDVQAGSFMSETMRIRELTRPRAPLGRERELFCCAFIRNPEPTRMRAIEALSRIGRVDVYGAATGTPVVDKLRIARKYRFILCFENDLYPGYVTEKPLEGWWTGALPLWWGDDPAGFLNSNAMINLKDFESIGAFVDAVGELNGSARAFEAANAQPILRRGFPIAGIYERIRTVVASL